MLNRVNIKTKLWIKDSGFSLSKMLYYTCFLLTIFLENNLSILYRRGIMWSLEKKGKTNRVRGETNQ